VPGRILAAAIIKTSLDIGGNVMGDKSPKDKMKQKKQHDKEVVKNQQHKQENMAKNRRDQGAPGNQPDPHKKAG